MGRNAESHKPEVLKIIANGKNLSKTYTEIAATLKKAGFKRARGEYYTPSAVRSVAVKLDLKDDPVTLPPRPLVAPAPSVTAQPLSIAPKAPTEHKAETAVMVLQNKAMPLAMRTQMAIQILLY